MFVRKFEGDSLDEALQAVKRELGPDAIILKTVSNKGLKGAFKKNRIEITAAISEQNYEKKARVDHVLSDDQKQDFYQTPASRINHMINDYEEHRPKPSGYGNMGLNKVVKTVSKASNKIKNSLDDFLAMEDEPRNIEKSYIEEQTTQTNPASELSSEEIEQYRAELNDYHQRQEAKEISHTNEVSVEFQQQLKTQNHQIALLEEKLFELTQKLSEKSPEDSGPKGVMALRTTLRSLELSEVIVQSIIKKALFELEREALDDADILYEFALREINEMVNVKMPLFSDSESKDQQVVTVLLSESSAGQSSMAMKVAMMQKNIRVIRLRENEHTSQNSDFVAKIFNLDLVCVQNLSLLMTEAKKAIQEGKSIVLDLKLSFKDQNETKKFLEMIKRSFERVEILLNLSGIHSELYNRKIVSKYKVFANGIVISFLDQCLSFGSLINIQMESGYLPFKFYGTGATVPDDIEAASAERILAGMFQF